MKTVIIENQAKLQLQKAYKYIRKQSYQNAEKVRTKILEAIAELPVNPERYPPDKYCLENDGRFRSFEIYKYRITYYIDETAIIVVRIRHTKMNPTNY